MSKAVSAGSKPIRLRHYGIVLAVVWMVAVCTSIAWNLTVQRDQIYEEARLHARISINKDILYRRWATSVGGVYVKVSDKTPPSPYLAHMAERDMISEEGHRFTLVNPAYIARLVNEMDARETGNIAHITSLQPLRPENAPDAWERKALETLAQGMDEVSGVELIGGVAHMRLMRPLRTEEACLKCHTEPGLAVGGLRGGVSAAVPMTPLWTLARSSIVSVSMGHGIILLLGLLGIGLGLLRLRNRIRERYKAEAALQHSQAFLQKVVDEIPQPLLVINRDYSVALANRAVREMAGARIPLCMGASATRFPIAPVVLAVPRTSPVPSRWSSPRRPQRAKPISTTTVVETSVLWKYLPFLYSDRMAKSFRSSKAATISRAGNRHLRRCRSIRSIWFRWTRWLR